MADDEYVVDVNAELDTSSVRAVSAELAASLRDFTVEVDVETDVDTVVQQFGQSLARSSLVAGAEGAAAGQAYSAAFSEAASDTEVDIDQNVDVDSGGSRLGRLFARSFGGSATRSLGPAIAAFLARFSTLIQGGIVASPVFGGALLATIVPAFSAAGVAAAGAFTLAFGGGIAGLGFAFAAQSERVRSVWSDLGDDLGNQMRDLAQPLEGVLVNVANQARRAFNGIAPALGQAFSAMAPVLNTFVNQLGTQLGQLGPFITQMVAAFDPLLTALGNRLPAIFDAITQAFLVMAQSIDPQVFASVVVGMFRVVQGGAEIIAFFSRIGNVLIPMLISAFSGLSSFLQPVFAAIGAGIGQIAGTFQSTLLPAIQQLLPILQPVFNFLREMFSGAIIGVINGFVNIIRGAFTAIAGVINVFVSALRGDWSGVWSGLGQIASGALRAVVGFVQTILFGSVLGIFRSVARTLLNVIWRGLWGSMRGVVRAGLGNIGGTIRGLMNGILGFFRSIWQRMIQPVVNGVRSMFNAVRNGFRNINDAISNAWQLARTQTSNGVSAVLEFVRRLPGLIASGLSRLGSMLGSLFSSAWSRALSAVTSGISRLISAVGRIPNQIVAALAGIGSLLFGVGQDVVEGMIRGITSMGGAVADAAANVAKNAFDAATNFLGIGSPSKLFMGVGEDTMEGFAIGIQRQAEEAARTMQDTLNRALPVAPTVALPDVVAGSVTGGIVPNVGSTTGTDRSVASAGTVVNQNFYGPTTGGDRLREMTWTLRYATGYRGPQSFEGVR